MTVITCGRTNLDERTEARTRALREWQGFRTDGGCGRRFDLDHPIQHLGIYRCLECARWLCQPCIRAHFEESRHDQGAEVQRDDRQSRKEANTRTDMALHPSTAHLAAPESAPGTGENGQYTRGRRTGSTPITD